MLLKIIDFGLVVLIWIVQLVIYPSFQFYANDDLIRWHGKYTSSITWIVAPLMLGQIVTHGFDTFQNPGPIKIASLVLVLGTWFTTFLIFVPLHNKIDMKIDLPQTIHNLISYNWIRTIMWTLIFLISLSSGKE